MDRQYAWNLFLTTTMLGDSQERGLLGILQPEPEKAGTSVVATRIIVLVWMLWPISLWLIHVDTHQQIFFHESPLIESQSIIRCEFLFLQMVCYSLVECWIHFLTDYLLLVLLRVVARFDAQECGRNHLID